MLLHKLKTSRLSVNLEFEIMEYLQVSKLLDAIVVLSQARNYLFDLTEAKKTEHKEQWLENEQNKRILAINKAKNLIKKAYETQYILK